MPKKNRYTQLIEKVFFNHYKAGASEVLFDRTEFVDAARKLGVAVPKNLGDVLYSFRYRVRLPERILKKAPEGTQWVIRAAGQAKYKFQLTAESRIEPSPLLAVTKVLDATPGLIDKYALGDEQALLAKIRYNRLIDTFTSLTCYSLQSHLRTTVPDIGQVETDEIYLGLDKRGAHFVIPVEAKSPKDRVGVVQIEQDFAVCATKFPKLIARPVAAQFMDDGTIAMFAFEAGNEGVAISAEKHYRLVPPSELSEAELRDYQNRQD